MNHKGVCRLAPVTPGLLKIYRSGCLLNGRLSMYIYGRLSDSEGWGKGLKGVK